MTRKFINIYLKLRFGLANTINDYLRFKIANQIRHKTGFRVQNYLMNLFSSAVNLQRSLCSQKAGVNVRIKALWCTNIFALKIF